METILVNENTEKSMKTSKEFVKNLIKIKKYWLDTFNKNKDYNYALSVEEVADGIIFSILTMIDGQSSINDYQYLTIIDERVREEITSTKLHELYCNLDKESK